MFTNNLNGAYEYERERRNDEMRAAQDSQWLRVLGPRRRLGWPSPKAILIVLALLIIVIRAF